ncbi:DNA-binding transcriptional regulator, AcrR family [Evansella caseinilytica]|uniref:DNA-binding transcriptional regulator, AcrR family n=1 Tax=Evansella caseinilytica TaxID=1503961 RepID=A0A1H3PNU4_9BACI|nr:TetR/AcrR family transcriptional regulator [Evansella caseinilytica]SDZ02892.1 DNA-binding transcriptional regulator, AcrR family [Evansella caseinilytica]
MDQQKEAFVSTEDRLLSAAMDLMEKKGYKAVTTKEIAAKAGFCEMTLFRHFGTKQKLLEDAVNRYSYIMDMEKILMKNVQYNLKNDLALVSKTYHKYVKRNEKIILLAFQERNTNPEIAKKVAENPKILKEYLINYFEEMQRRGKMIDIDAEATAMQFLWMNLGYFISGAIGGEVVSTMAVEQFIEQSVSVFARGVSQR